MEKNNDLTKVGIKNYTKNQFDGITKIEDFGFENILLDEKLATMGFFKRN